MSSCESVVAEYLASPGRHKLEIGAGGAGKPGWLSADLHPRPSADGNYSIVMDATQPFPLPDAAFDFIYSEHMIEHIPYADGRRMVRECFRVLKPEGVLRIST